MSIVQRKRIEKIWSDFVNSECPKLISANWKSQHGVKWACSWHLVAINTWSAFMFSWTKPIRFREIQFQFDLRLWWRNWFHYAQNDLSLIEEAIIGFGHLSGWAERIHQNLISYSLILFPRNLFQPAVAMIEKLTRSIYFLLLSIRPFQPFVSVKYLQFSENCLCTKQQSPCSRNSEKCSIPKFI